MNNSESLLRAIKDAAHFIAVLLMILLVAVLWIAYKVS